MLGILTRTTELLWAPFSMILGIHNYIDHIYMMIFNRSITNTKKLYMYMCTYIHVYMCTFKNYVHVYINIYTLFKNLS